MQNVLELRCAPLPTVRIALIGLGGRGRKTLERYAYIEGAEIRCLADTDADKAAEANEALLRSRRPAADVVVGSEAWREVCRRPDIDLVYICTDWSSHCRMAVEAMRCGKHVAVEVPAATTIDECHLLVETSEATRRHCFMTENCCYDYFALATLEMQRRGLLGDLTHCEGAYIHNLRDTLGLTGNAVPAAHNWMERSCARHCGNPYPTHGIGPIGWLLNLHRGDRMDYLVSLTSRGSGTDHLLGRVNSTLIRTVGGAAILLQLDITSMRPYSRLQTVCGTAGYAQHYPVPTLKTSATATILTGDEALDEAHRYMTSHAARLWQEGHRLGVPNEMNYTMDARLIYCLRHGLPLDIDVYDAAEWSALAELSERSAREGSRPISIPDFTHGHWRDLPGHRMFTV
jgi:predicted dehydrogenase